MWSREGGGSTAGFLQPSSTAGSRQETSHLLLLIVSAPVNGRLLLRQSVVRARALFNLAPAGG